MTQKNPFADFFTQNDFSKIMEQYQGTSFDMEALMETQRKNIQALNEAQQLAMENMQAIAQRQSQILSQMVEDNSALAKGLMSEGTPEQKIASNAKAFKSIYGRTVKSVNELSELVNKSNLETTNLINKRISASMNEIQSSLEKAQTKAAATGEKKAA